MHNRQSSYYGKCIIEKLEFINALNQVLFKSILKSHDPGLKS